MARILTKKARDKHDLIVVQEKLDGSNVGVARLPDGELVPLIRAGYPAVASHYEQHRIFAAWTYENIQRFEFLEPGERLCGEWLAQAHGTKYRLDYEPFVVFDLMRGESRETYQRLCDRIRGDFVQAHLIHMGTPISVERVMEYLTEDGRNGYHGAIDPVEGAVWRVERQGKVDFLGKYVRPDKVDGSYLVDRETGKQLPPTWNWRPTRPISV